MTIDDAELARDPHGVVHVIGGFSSRDPVEILMMCFVWRREDECNLLEDGAIAVTCLWCTIAYAEDRRHAP